MGKLGIGGGNLQGHGCQGLSLMACAMAGIELVGGWPCWGDGGWLGWGGVVGGFGAGLGGAVELRRIDRLAVAQAPR